MAETVSSLWIGPRLSPLESLCIRSFLALGHGFDLYVYEEVEGVPAGARIRDGAEILPADSVFAYKDGPGRGSYSAFSNRFRYKLLQDAGGWWVDMDVVAQRPLLFEQEHVFAWETEEFIGSAVLRMPAGSELAARCYDEASALGSDIRWGQAGPRLLTRVIRELALDRHALPRSTFYPVAWDEWQALIEPRESAVIEAAHAVHLWNEMFRRNEIDKEGSFPADSALGRLMRTYP